MAIRTVTLTVEMHSDTPLDESEYDAWIDDIQDAVNDIAYVSGVTR